MENFDKIAKEEAGNENNVPKKKGKKAIKVSIAAVSAVALIATGIFIGSRFLGNSSVTVDNNGVQNSNITSDNTNVNTEPETFQPETTELVTDAFTYTGTTKDGNNETFTYKIPKINIDSEDVTKINNEINEKIISKAKEIILEVDKGFSAWIYKIDYTYYINGNILSIMIEQDFSANDIKNYNVYNIDRNTGNRLSNEEVLKYCNLSKEEFTKNLTSVLKLKFEEKYGTVNSYIKGLRDAPANWTESELAEQKKFYEAQYNKTISSDNCNADTQMIYLDTNGKINIIAQIYSLAGADSYYYIVKLNDNNVTTNEKINLTQDEISKLETFINEGENNAFLLLDYNSPDDIFKNEKNKYNTMYSPEYILSYAIDCSKYAYESTEEQDKVIWQGSNGEAQVSTKVTTEDDMIKFFQEKLDYTFTKEILREIFKSNFYSQLNNVYVNTISDTVFTPFSIEDGYKQNNKYYLTLHYNNGLSLVPASEVPTEVVLVEKNGTYYFYSCNTNKVKELNKEQITKLETFLNKGDNNSFTLLNYNSNTDLLENIDNQPHKGILKYSIALSTYCSEATQAQENIIYKDRGGRADSGDTYVITEENLIKFLDEKLGSLFSKESLKEAFKDNYNKDLNMYVFWMSDSAYTKATIKEGCKIGYEYYLTLNHGQKVVLFERSNGEIFFESCIGYDGTIGQ